MPTRRAADTIEMERVRATAPPETAVLTVEQVAAWLQVGTDTVLALKLPSVELSDRNLRIPVRLALQELERRARHRSASGL